MVDCPICGRNVKQAQINEHIDSNCTAAIESEVAVLTTPSSNQSFFKTPLSKRDGFFSSTQPARPTVTSIEISEPTTAKKRSFEEIDPDTSPAHGEQIPRSELLTNGTVPKRQKASALERAAPLAERMRPKTLDDIFGQDLVSTTGVLRGLIETDRVPSMILWGGPGTGKTTIARLVAQTVHSRFIEINSTSTGVAECKKLFSDARSELTLTGRKTIIFCDEIHRFSKVQQDVFLGPVEAGHITLIGATTENPSFKVQAALLSRCRVFTLAKLSTDDITSILQRCLTTVRDDLCPGPLVDDVLLTYLAQFSDGDARTGLNLLDLAISLSRRPGVTLDDLKQALTKTLVYDRAGDQHYDTISAFHKSVRGNNADAALYYLVRMIASGEDPLYIARRMIVIASEDVGLADNTMLPLAIATYSACQQIGLPECRINLAHCTVALCLAPKSTRAYQALKQAENVVKEPGVAGLAIPIHLRNAPTRLMKEMGYGAEYKYPPNFRNGLVKQDYLPEQLIGTRFLGENDLGDEIDPDLQIEDEADAEATRHDAEREDAQEEGKGEDTVPVNCVINDDDDGDKGGGSVKQEEIIVEGVTLDHNTQEDDGDEQASSQTAAPEDWQ